MPGDAIVLTDDAQAVTCYRSSAGDAWDCQINADDGERYEARVENIDVSVDVVDDRGNVSAGLQTLRVPLDDAMCGADRSGDEGHLVCATARRFSRW